MTVEDLQRSLDGYEAEVVRARDTCITVLDNFAGLLKNMRGEITLAVEELDKLQRLGGAMRATNRNKSVPTSHAPKFMLKECGSAKPLNPSASNGSGRRKVCGARSMTSLRGRRSHSQERKLTNG